MKKQSTAFRCYKTPLTSAMSNDDVEATFELLAFLNEQVSILLADPRFVGCVRKHVDERQTNFITCMNADYGKPYEAWDPGIGSRAKYYRIVLHQIHRVFQALMEREQVSAVCQRHGWDVNEMKDIHEEYHRLHGVHIPYTLISNICKSKAFPTQPATIHVSLDYSIEDDCISRRIDDVDERHISWELNISKKWRRLETEFPYYAPALSGKIVRPIIYGEWEGDELVSCYVKQTYEATIHKHRTVPNRVLGIDLGEEKKFSAIVVEDDRVISPEIRPSRELDGLQAKKMRLWHEINRLSTKIEANEKLLSNRFDEALARKIERQKAARAARVSKLSRLKAHMSCVQARDVEKAVIEYQVSEARVEDLHRLNLKGSQRTARWCFASDRFRLVNRLSLLGVPVNKVDPAFTSQTNPFTNAVANSDNDRSVRCQLPDGGRVVLDRDVVGALNVGRCERRARSSPVLLFSGVLCASFVRS